VGDHIRPRFRIPESWHWPVGVSLSNEIGYQRPEFSADSWTWKIRPIVDKKMRRCYLSFNPTLDRSFHGPGVNQGVVFSSNFKSVTTSLNESCRAGVLRFVGTDHGLQSTPRSATAVLSCHGRRSGSRVGVQLWRGHRATASIDQVHYQKALFLNPDRK
jgi:hypothetical protein